MCVCVCVDYLSLFYLAFVKPFTSNDPCILNQVSGKSDCMYELQQQLTSLFITKAIIQQFQELGLPYIRSYINKWIYKIRAYFSQMDSEDVQGSIRLLTNVEEENGEYDVTGIEECYKRPYKCTMADFGEVIVRHGYIIMFGVAFPLSALILFIGNLIEYRTDLYKMLAIQRRPKVTDVDDIGAWLNILNFLTSMSLVTTAGIVTITSDDLESCMPSFLGDWEGRNPAVNFFLFEHFLLVARLLLRFLIADVPDSTLRALARQKFIIARCFDIDMKAYYLPNKGLKVE